MARDYRRDARDWDYPGEGGHAYGRGRGEGGYGRDYWSNADREYGGRDFGGRDFGGRDFDRGYAGAYGAGPRGRWREFADTWRAQGEQWRDYENREHGRDYPRYGYASERDYGEMRGDYREARPDYREYRGDLADRDRFEADRYDRDRGDRDRGGRYGRYGNQERYDFTGRSWHAGPETWEAERPGPSAFMERNDIAETRGTSGEWRGFGGAGYMGGSGGYGHGGALEYGRGGMDVGGRDQDWGIGDTRHASGGMGALRGSYEGGRGSMGRGFAGLGPRSYRRSDERIREEVCEALTRHPGIDASDIDLRVENGEVTLTGEVEDRRARRLAEEIAEQCAGVSDVHNELGARRGLGLFGDQDRTTDREVSRTTMRDATTRGATTGTTGARTGASAGATGSAGAGGTPRARRAPSEGMTSPDSTQTALRADTGEPDERTRVGGTGTTAAGATNSGERNR